MVTFFLVAISLGPTVFGNVAFLVTVGAKTTIMFAIINCCVTFFVTVIAFDSCWFFEVQHRIADISLDLLFPVTLKSIQVSLDFIEALGLTTELDQCHERLILSSKPLRLIVSLLHLLQLASFQILMPPRDIYTQLCSPTATFAEVLASLSTAAVAVSHNFCTLLAVPPKPLVRPKTSSTSH